MSKTGGVDARQLWSAKSSTKLGPPAFCTPFVLPSGGVLVYNDTYTTTLHKSVQFMQPCVSNTTILNPGSTGNTTVVGVRDPFYASTSPQIFAIATATVISYLLVILIFITPRTFFVGGPGGGAGFLGRRGMISGSYGGSSVVGIGRRPWLQKIATITVAISLTIATADTFKVAELQYDLGYIDSGRLVDDVVGSLEIRIVRVISDTFLWLAQVQTLIRLFPRHKEKVTIKWLGFAMVSFDTVFSILNDFVNQSVRTRPRSFKDAIPALSYLFELAISLIYASCVIYYSLSKRRFAFYHPKMRNVCLVALLSFMAVLIPIAFFILDVSNPDVAGWGDYIRWVGAAAASVVVWEWVERIEALERDERKDGILGREIFDGDEMLGEEPSDEVNWPGRRAYWEQNGFPAAQAPGDGGLSTQLRALRPRIPFATRLGRRSDNPTDGEPNAQATTDTVNQPAIPPQAVTPVSRSDTTSAASTVYAVRYHNANSPSPAIPEEAIAPDPQIVAFVEPKTVSDLSGSTGNDSDATRVAPQEEVREAHATTGPGRSLPNPVWRAVPNPFKRKRTSPPAEVAGAQLTDGPVRRSPVDVVNMSLRNRLSGLTTSRRTRPSERTAGGSPAPMPVTVIPAQRRGHRIWSLDENLMEDEVGVRTPEPAPAANYFNEAAITPFPFSRPPTAEMPVTVIPAPRRGQRTWSPDDLRHDHSAVPLQTLSPNRNQEQSQSSTHTNSPESQAEHQQLLVSRTALSTRKSRRFSEQSRRLTALRTVSEHTSVGSGGYDPGGDRPMEPGAHTYAHPGPSTQSTAASRAANEQESLRQGQDQRNAHDEQQRPSEQG